MTLKKSFFILSRTENYSSQNTLLNQIKIIMTNIKIFKI